MRLPKFVENGDIAFFLAGHDFPPPKLVEVDWQGWVACSAWLGWRCWKVVLIASSTQCASSIPNSLASRAKIRVDMKWWMAGGTPTPKSRPTTCRCSASGAFILLPKVFSLFPHPRPSHRPLWILIAEEETSCMVMVSAGAASILTCKSRCYHADVAWSRELPDAGSEGSGEERTREWLESLNWSWANHVSG